MCGETVKARVVAYIEEQEFNFLISRFIHDALPIIEELGDQATAYKLFEKMLADKGINQDPLWFCEAFGWQPHTLIKDWQRSSVVTQDAERRV